MCSASCILGISCNTLTRNRNFMRIAGPFARLSVGRRSRDLKRELGVLLEDESQRD